MAITARGFAGTTTQHDESSFSQWALRGFEGSYRHVVWSGGVVTPGAGLNVSVDVIDALVGGVRFTSDGPTTVAMSANNSTRSRYDLVCAEVNWGNTTSALGTPTRSVSLVNVVGTAAANPVLPTLTQNAGTLWQMPLAWVTRAPNETAISPDFIQTVKPLRRQARQKSSAVAVASMNTSTNWRNIGDVLFDDPGWPFVLQIDAQVRFERVTGTDQGFGQIRAMELGGAEYGQGVTSNLSAGRAAATLSKTTSVLTGKVHVLLDMSPSGAGITNAQPLTVLDGTYNHFTVTQLPA